MIGRDDEGDGRDPAIDEFAALWRELVPPDPAAAVDAPDAATRALLERLRGAWRACAPASSAPPWPIRWRLARRRLAPPVAAAAAAVLLLALGHFLLPRPHAPVIPPPAAPAAATTPAPAAIPLVSIDPARMELRRGPVRVILVTPPPVARHSPKDTEHFPVKEPN